MIKRGLLFIFVSLFLLFPVAALAIPELGVESTEGGSYYGPEEDYIKHFVGDQFFPIPHGFDSSGFAVPESGGSLTIWAGYEGNISPAWFKSGIRSYEVWLLTDSPSGPSFSFNGEKFISNN